MSQFKEVKFQLAEYSQTFNAKLRELTEFKLETKAEVDRQNYQLAKKVSN